MNSGHENEQRKRQTRESQGENMRKVIALYSNRIILNRLANWTIAILALVFGSVSISAQATGSEVKSAGAAEQSAAHKYFTDVILVDQDGNNLRFYSDLLEGKVVIINSFFGT